MNDPCTSDPTPVLIGLRGSGKSTVARLLASALRRTFVDLDDLTPVQLGEKDVAAAFGKHGETAFRAAETQALQLVLAHSGIVLALGGGTPTAPGAADVLRHAQAHGKIRLIYLRADAETLARRLAPADNAHRPSLTGRGVTDEVAEVLAKRDPLYRSLAWKTLEVGEMTAQQVVAALMAALDPIQTGGSGA